MKKFTLNAIVASLALVGSYNVQAEAVIGEQLANTIPTMDASATIMAVVTFDQMTPVSAAQVSALKGLGISKGVQFSTVPVIGVVVNSAQINEIAQRDDVRSVWLNRKLDYFNANSRQLTGVDKVQGAEFLARNGTEYTGKGVTIMVNDSGIDALHQDLMFGDVVVDNVQAATHSLDLLETGITDGFVVRNQPNTDLNVGHGTHCAGTIAGSGAMSDGKYKGVAPDADLVGYGSGAGLFILDAVGGYDYAIQNVYSYENPLRIMSNSWGSSGKFNPYGPVAMSSYIGHKLGILSVFAAGNSGEGENSHNPYAQIPWGMSVGAGDINGNLVDFSSRGLAPESGNFIMPDGEEWDYSNEVTIVGPGRFVVSTRSSTNMVANGGEDDSVIAAEHIPFYTRISGTSMSTPHVAGVAALMMEANPSLNNDQIKQLMKESATNMPGYESWEVGAGYVNAQAAVAAAKGYDLDHKASVNNSDDSEFYASINMHASMIDEGSIAFENLESQVVEFEVDALAKTVNVGITALASVAVVLESPDGTVYRGTSTDPVWDGNSYASAPAQAGTWKLSIDTDTFGLSTGLENAAYEDAAQTDAASDNHVQYWAWENLHAGTDGLGDIEGHAQQDSIENAISRRLMDARPSGNFAPNANLSRQELAKALVMGASVRQHRALDNEPTANVSGVANRYRMFAESVSMPGAALKDPKHQYGPVMLADNGDFRGSDSVTRSELAYSLIQVAGLTEKAMEYGENHTITISYAGSSIAIADQDLIPAELIGHVQVALDEGLIGVQYSVEQGPYDLEPTIIAHFNPDSGVSRAHYALIANLLDEKYFVKGTRANSY